MTSELTHPTVDVDVDGTATRPTGGSLQLDALAVPYASASVVLPLTADTVLDVLDPREDHRVTITGGNTGSWDMTGATAYIEDPAVSGSLIYQTAEDS